jgi:hypothetical protein
MLAYQYDTRRLLSEEKEKPLCIRGLPQDAHNKEINENGVAVAM